MTEVYQVVASRGLPPGGYAALLKAIPDGVYVHCTTPHTWTGEQIDRWVAQGRLMPAHSRQRPTRTVLVSTRHTTWCRLHHAYIEARSAHIPVVVVGYRNPLRLMFVDHCDPPRRVPPGVSRPPAAYPPSCLRVDRPEGWGAVAYALATEPNP